MNAQTSPEMSIPPRSQRCHGLAFDQGTLGPGSLEPEDSVLHRILVYSRVIPGTPNNGTPNNGNLPGILMGIVWEAYHNKVPLLGVQSQ